MTVIIINDCRDDNALARQTARVEALFASPVSFIGVINDVEASGNLIDALDAVGGTEAVLLANVAPRNGHAKKWGNGTPFGYFWYRKTLVVTSIDGMTLSLVKKFKLAEGIKALDMPASLKELIQARVMSQVTEERILTTQFRSFEFLPRAAFFIHKYGEDLPHKEMPISDVPDALPAVWWIDSFGNCKTTILLKDIAAQANGHLNTKLGELAVYPRLKDVPDKVAALVTGSSGIEGKRFLELVVQGESAAKHFNLATGDRIL